MARLARVVVPGIPHHIVQRGTRRMKTFFRPSDYEMYLSLLVERAAESRVRIWGHALMPNHVHLIAVPESEDGLRWAIGETHRRYTSLVNQREGWTGYLWQGRFSSCPMDTIHCLNAARYIELNPVRAGLVALPESYSWSSARAHLQAQDDDVVEVRPLLDMTGDWRDFLAEPLNDEAVKRIRDCQRTGRPLGSDEF
ncbi:MAG: transposase, partial [Deltaproteobacteria bacterium RIFOXYB2_FULL_66_7]